MLQTLEGLGYPRLGSLARIYHSPTASCGLHGDPTKLYPLTIRDLGMSLILAILCSGLLTLGLSSTTYVQSTDEPPSMGRIELKSLDGRTLDDRSAEWRVICFLGTECPVARAYARPLQQLSERFASKPIQFVGVFSNLHDSPADVERFIKEFNLTFPQVHDRLSILPRPCRPAVFQRLSF